MTAGSNRIEEVEAGMGAKGTSEEERGLKGVWGVCSDQHLPERTSEKRFLRGRRSQVPLLSKQKKLFCEKDKDIGEFICMERKGGVAGGGRVRAEACIWGKEAQGSMGREDAGGASCLVRVNEGGGDLSSLESGLARVPGSIWPGHQGTVCHTGVG